ncbi:MAG: S8 family peptidase [Candidatus Cloacimonetes bacterium]|nr:S8 family peptidase [Candidatus Cloacimonadota bacterium]
MEKLPIREIHKRENDSKFVEGGGSSDLPKFVLSGEDLDKKASYLSNRLLEIKNSILSIITDDSLPGVLIATLIDKAKAKTHKTKIRKFFEFNKINQIIRMKSDNQLLIQVDSEAAFNEIEQKINNTTDYAYQISSLLDINIFSPQVTIDDKKIDYKVKLLSYNNNDSDFSIAEKFETELIKNKVDFEKTHYSHSLKTYRLKNLIKNDVIALYDYHSYSSIFSIEPIPKAFIEFDSVNPKISIPIEYPNDEQEYPIIGILDSGIEPIDSLKPWLVKDRFTPYQNHEIDTSHGTFVAGIVVYGDALEDFAMTGTERCMILDACVLPDSNIRTITEDELIDNIRAAISEYHEKVKIWTLSISITKEVVDDDFSDFAIALDEIQKEFNVLIFKSAGNTQNYNLFSNSDRRIHQGADSVRALTIGSAAHYSDNSSLASLYNVSPFSRIGNGPASIIKPEVIHYGGNISKIGAKFYKQGVRSFAIDGSLATSIGTSFSTPRTSSLGGALLSRIDYDFDPTLVKALIVHSAKYLSTDDLKSLDIVKHMGYGIPQSVNDILFNDPYSSTLILRDNLRKSSIIDIFDFPLPDCLIKNGFFTGNISITLVYHPILDTTQGSEYCQTDLEIKFGTYEKIKERDIEKNSILNRFGREGSKNVLLPSVFSKKASKNNDHLDEHSLIEFGDKYYPIKKYTLSLDNLTETNKEKYLKSTRKWYLYLKGIYRDNLTYKSEQTGEVLSQDFTLIITISDPDKIQPVYDSLLQKLDEYNFVSNAINIKTNVKVEN